MKASVPKAVALSMLLAGCTAGGGPGTDPSSTLPDRPIDRVARFLRGDVASELQVRVWVEEGVEVPGDPWVRLVDLLEEVTDKPGGISVDVVPVSLPSQDWTFDGYEAELDRLAQPVGGDVAVMDILAARGAYLDNDDPVLGLSWSWSRIVLLVDPLTEACDAAAGGGSGSGHTRICEATWSAIARHEAGHVIGLVGNGAPMVEDHEDPEHVHHDPDPDCLMYYAWDRAELSGRVADEDLELCDASLADLAAIRDAADPP